MIVNSLTFLALVWYTVETMRLRRAAREQVEGMSKPCLTIWPGLRDSTDAILDMHGAVGGTIASGDQGNFAVENIGNGVALNVTYHFDKSRFREPNGPRPESYFLNVLQSQKIAMPEREVVFCFESIGGRRYQSTITMSDRPRPHGFSSSRLPELRPVTIPFL